MIELQAYLDSRQEHQRKSHADPKRSRDCSPCREPWQPLLEGNGQHGCSTSKLAPWLGYSVYLFSRHVIRIDEGSKGLD